MTISGLLVAEISSVTLWSHVIFSPYLSFWGKARPAASDSAGEPFHPLAFHSLDVAAVGQCWLAAAPERAEAASRWLGIDTPQWSAFVVFLLALHDVGKFSHAFQAKVPALWPPCLGAPPMGLLFDPGHDTTGFALLLHPDCLDLEALTGRAALDLAPLLRAVTGHHGRPPREEKEWTEHTKSKASRQALAQYVQAAHAVLKPPVLPHLAEDAQRRCSWWLAGLAVLADWIGSSQHWFPYCAPDRPASLDAYWTDYALPRAEVALREAGVLPSRTARSGQFRALAAGRTATPMQALAETIALPAGPVLVVIEDATGAGKTEAALILAHRLMAAGHADGVFVALPTMATADAMFARVATAYRSLYEPGATPSLALMHGRAMDNAGFRASILPGTAPDAACGDATPGDGAGEGPEDEAGPDATSQCAAWLASDRRRAFLADIGVGTIDQALLAVLPTRFSALRLQGLQRKILIIDEAHAYDPYMHEEVERLLTFHALQGGNAIVLSATLPRAKRHAIVMAFRGPLGAAPGLLASDAFPLMTVAAEPALHEAPCAMREELTREVAIERLDTAEAIAHRLTAAARAGGCAAWVRNTVADAIAGAALLRAAGIEPILFHARFALGDRLAIQDRVMAAFGPEGEGRAGHVVVATQVIEQSLDLDFDLMASDLAPVDLLIQRAGRLWRHPRKSRPVQGPVLLVLSPEPVDDPAPDWAAGPLGGTRYVYESFNLWRSARSLFAAGRIAAPGNLRALVESVYPDPLPAPPPGLQRAANEAEGEAKSDEQTATYTLLKPQCGYVRSAGAWEPEERTPTRLGELGRIFRLARREPGQLVPYFGDGDPRRRWSLSEVTLRASLATDAPATLEIEALRAGWSRWEREIPVLVLDRVGEGWVTQALRAATSVKFAYHAEIGLLPD